MNKIRVLIPLFLLTGSPVAIAAGDRAGGHDHEAHWMAPDAEQKRTNPFKPTENSIRAGARLFQQNCATCHGARAVGNGPAGVALNPKPTNLRAMSGRHTDGDFAWKIRHGRGAMPAWGASLDDAKIWHLVNYIQSLGQSPAMLKSEDHEHSGHKH